MNDNLLGICTRYNYLYTITIFLQDKHIFAEVWKLVFLVSLSELADTGGVDR